ncbi:MAG: CdaR family protein, partial [Nitrospirota bacterium]
EINFIVPLELRNIPEGMLVVGNVPNFVDVRLQGRENYVKHLSMKDVAAFITLSNARTGADVYNITPANINVPPGITVTSVTPSEVKLRVEKLARKAVPVQPSLSGKPQNGYRVERADAFPRSVMVEGPANMLRKIGAVSTEDIDVEGASGNIERLVRLEQPSENGVSLGEETVRVILVISKSKGQAHE